MSVREAVLEVLERLPEHRAQQVLDYAHFLRTQDEDAEWMRSIAQEWDADLSDTRQDIYSLSDGEAVRGSG